MKGTILFDKDEDNESEFGSERNRTADDFEIPMEEEEEEDEEEDDDGDGYGDEFAPRGEEPPSREAILNALNFPPKGKNMNLYRDKVLPTSIL